MQLTYNAEPAIGRAGMLAEADAAKRVISRIAVGKVKAGLGAFRVPGYGTPGSSIADPGQAYQNPDPGVAADVDAIIATGASAASEQTLDADDADGVVGAGTMFPARRLTLVLSNHADWDATTAVIRYVDQDGRTQEESLAIPDGGNTTLTTAGFAVRFVSLTIPAQSGAGGTFTVGIAALDATINLADFLGVVLYDAAVEPYETGADAAEYGDGATLPILQRGPVWVETEDACAEGGDVYVRVAGGQLGAFRSDADSGDAVQVTGARWGRSSGPGGLNILVMGY